MEERNRTSEETDRAEGSDAIHGTEAAAEAEQPQQKSDVAIDVWTVALYSMQALGSIAWQMLGLRPDPVSGKISQDLEQARVAIDCVSALGGVLEANAPEENRRELRSLVQDLRVNFVKQNEKPREGSSST